MRSKKNLEIKTKSDLMLRFKKDTGKNAPDWDGGDACNKASHREWIEWLEEFILSTD